MIRTNYRGNIDGLRKRALLNFKDKIENVRDITKNLQDAMCSGNE